MQLSQANKKRGAAAAIVLTALVALPVMGQVAPKPALRTMRSASQELLMTVASRNPFSSVERPGPGDERLRGRVTEVLPAGGYTYFAIDSGGESRWVVTTSEGVAEGALVEVKNMGTKRDFRSKKLRRSFETLVFGSVKALPQETASAELGG